MSELAWMFKLTLLLVTFGRLPTPIIRKVRLRESHTCGDDGGWCIYELLCYSFPERAAGEGSDMTSRATSSGSFEYYSQGRFLDLNLTIAIRGPWLWVGCLRLTGKGGPWREARPERLHPVL
jgi:hypothetical protein